MIAVTQAVEDGLGTHRYVGTGAATEAALYRDIARIAADTEFALAGGWQGADECIRGGVINC